MRRRTSEHFACVLSSGERPMDVEELRGRARWDRIGMRMKQAVDWLTPMALWDTTCMGSHRASLTVERMEKLVTEFHREYLMGCPLVYGIELHPGGHGAHWHGTAQIGHRAATEKDRIEFRTSLWQSWFDLYG